LTDECRAVDAKEAVAPEMLAEWMGQGLGVGSVDSGQNREWGSDLLAATCMSELERCPSFPR